MEIPSWFGVTQYYALLLTVNFAIFSYIIVAFIRAGASTTNLKSKIISLKDWWRKRKERHYG